MDNYDSSQFFWPVAQGIPNRQFRQRQRTKNPVIGVLASVTLHGTGHVPTWHVSSCSRGPQDAPPKRATACVTLDRVLFPGPQAVLHELHSLHSLCLHACGHSCVLHAIDFVNGAHLPMPTAGVVTVLVFVISPPPQVQEHFPHSEDHSDTRQSAFFTALQHLA